MERLRVNILNAALAGTIRSEVRKWQLFVDGADVDDFSRRLSRAMRFLDECLGDEEQTFQVDVQHCVEIGFGGVPEIGEAFPGRRY